MKANHNRSGRKQLPQEFWEEGGIQRLAPNPLWTTAQTWIKKSKFSGLSVLCGAHLQRETVGYKFARWFDASTLCNEELNAKIWRNFPGLFSFLFMFPIEEGCSVINVFLGYEPWFETPSLQHFCSSIISSDSMKRVTKTSVENVIT